MNWKKILKNAKGKWYKTDDGFFYLEDLVYSIERTGVTTALNVHLSTHDERKFSENRRQKKELRISFFTKDIYAFRTGDKMFDSIFRKRFANEDELSPLLAKHVLLGG